MGLLDKLKERLGGATPAASQPYGGPVPRPSAPQDPDQQAIERYRYMLRTAPPEQVEQAHAEAFAKLTPEQRRQVLDQVGSGLPESERADSTEPRALARMATRAEMREPGTMERSLTGGPGGRGPGMGGIIAGSLLAGVAGAFIGTAIADAMFDDPGAGEAEAAGEEAAGEEAPPEEPPVEDPGFGGFDDGGGFGDF